MVGMSLVSSVTILPLFMSHLTGSLVLVGAVPALWHLGFVVPQLLGPAIYANRPIRKRAIVGQVYAGALALTAFGGLVVAFAEDHKIFVLLGFFPMVMTYMGFVGIAHTAWIDVIGKVIGEDKQSRLLGYSHAAGGLMGAGAVWIATRMMGDTPFPHGFGYSMIAAGCLAATAGTLFFFLREQPSPTTNGAASGVFQTIKKIPRLYAANRSLRSYAISRVVVGWGFAAFAFLTIYSVREMGASEKEAIGLTGILLTSQVLGSLGWGLVGDLKSPRWLPVGGSVMTVISLLFAFFGASMPSIYIAIFAGGLASAAFMNAELSIILHLSPSDERPTYYSIYSATYGILTLPAPLAVGLLLNTMSFRSMFGIATILCLAGLVLMVQFLRISRQSTLGAPPD